MHRRHKDPVPIYVSAITEFVVCLLEVRPSVADVLLAKLLVVAALDNVFT